MIPPAVEGIANDILLLARFMVTDFEDMPPDDPGAKHVDTLIGGVAFVADGLFKLAKENDAKALEVARDAPAILRYYVEQAHEALDPIGGPGLMILEGSEWSLHKFADRLEALLSPEEA